MSAPVHSLKTELTKSDKRTGRSQEIRPGVPE